MLVGSLTSPSHGTRFPALPVSYGRFGCGISCSQLVGLLPKLSQKVTSAEGVKDVKCSCWSKWTRVSSAPGHGELGSFNCQKLGFSALWAQKYDAEAASLEFTRKRKVVEHIFLFKAKQDLSDTEEKDMLDYLYTFQYHMRGIIAISLGRIEDPNVKGFTHAAFMRFQRKEDLAKFYDNSYSGVLKEHVLPYCHEFNFGVEFFLLMQVAENAIGRPIEDALATLTNLTAEFRSLIVQATQGENFNPSYHEFTHAAVIRFPSFEALELFRGSSDYKNMWNLKFQPITKESLEVHFHVDPVGTDIM